jgi:hypothetical protein
MEPYLSRAGAGGMSLSDASQARTMFQQLRVLLPQNLHSSVDDLENICEEKRQLDQQSRLHKILHGWLLVHIPLSYALLLLGAVHAALALLAVRGGAGYSAGMAGHAAGAGRTESLFERAAVRIACGVHAAVQSLPPRPRCKFQRASERPGLPVMS